MSVTRDGSVFAGINRVSPAALAETIKGSRPNKLEKKVYVKADAGTPYATIAKVLKAVRSAGGESAVLLTGQRVTPKPGIPVPPYGLAVLLGPPPRDGSPAAVVQLLDLGQNGAGIEINNFPVLWANLQTTLNGLLLNQRDKRVLVKAAGTLPYTDVVHVIDVCCLMGASVALVM